MGYYLNKIGTDPPDIAAHQSLSFVEKISNKFFTKSSSLLVQFDPRDVI